MTSKPPPSAAVWDYVEDLLQEEELERLSKLSPAELRAEMIQKGLDPNDSQVLWDRAVAESKALPAPSPAAPEGPPVVDGPAKPAQPATVVSMRQVRTRRAAPTLRLAMAWAASAAAAVTVYVERADIAAWLHLQGPRPGVPAPPSPSPTPSASPSPSPSVLSPRERAAQLREMAYASCAKHYFAQCEDQLDDAKALDPDGDLDVRVREARALAFDGQHPDAGEWAKPPLGPGERPLRKPR